MDIPPIALLRQTNPQPVVADLAGEVRQRVGWAKARSRRAHHNTRMHLAVGSRSLSSGAHSRDPLA